jgi:DNA polymerase III epsilon subunit-like protein
MLAFDIETTGLDPASNVVTVVCTEDFHTGERRAYEFGRVRMCEPQNEELLRSELIQAFDEAESLCAFNGVRFDIPFLHTTLKLSDDTTTSWLFKTTDILEAARLGIFGPTHTFGLNLLCQHNNVSVKSGSGLQAIQFAREQKWEELKSYCADDVRILCDLYRRQLLNNPRFHHVIDLSTSSRQYIFLEEQGEARASSTD